MVDLTHDAPRRTRDSGQPGRLYLHPAVNAMRVCRPTPEPISMRPQCRLDLCDLEICGYVGVIHFSVPRSSFARLHQSIGCVVRIAIFISDFLQSRLNETQRSPVSGHGACNAHHTPAHQSRRVVLFKVRLEPLASRVPPSGPCASFDFQSQHVLRPSKVETPSPWLGKLQFPLRAWQTSRA